MGLSPELLAPIDGGNPAGADLRYDPLHDRIKQARYEDPDLPSGDWGAPRKTADWALVVRLSTEALAKRSKDLQIAVWLTEAWLRREGYAGLRQGLELIQALLAEFWEHLYPELDEDGDTAMRAAPLAWLGLKLDLAVKQAPITAGGASYLDYFEAMKLPTEAEAEEDYEGSKKAARQRAVEEGKLLPEQFEQAFAATPKAWYREAVADLEASLERIAELDRTGEDQFGDEAPSYRALQGAVDEVLRTVRQLLARKLTAEPDPIEAPPTEALVAELAAGAGPGSATGGAGAAVAAGSHPAASVAGGAAGGAAGGVPASVPGAAAGFAAPPATADDAAARIGAVARFLRSQTPTNPAPYLMLRGFRWGELRAGGGEIDPRLLEAPPTEVRVRLKSLFLDGNWAALLELAEEVMATAYGRGWLDLQRYAVTACEGLGGEFDPVAAGIRGALRSLLHDLPALTSLTLMDDSATANAETLHWLRDGGFLGSDGDAEDPTPRPRARERSGSDREPRDRALERVRNGDPQGAIELLMREATTAKSARARFLRRADAAGIMVNAGLESVALPILRDLVELVAKHQLDEWESGELIAEPLGLLYRCLQKLDEDASGRQELYLRVCRLDPIHAMSLAPLTEADTSAGTENESGW